MSAFICSSKHINTIVSYGIQKGASAYVAGASGKFYWQSFELDPSLIVNILTNANTRSVNKLLGKKDSISTAKYAAIATAYLSPVQIIKLCDCFDYQASEIDDYDQSAAAEMIRSVRALAIDSLPGYADAHWSI